MRTIFALPKPYLRLSLLVLLVLVAASSASLIKDTFRRRAVAEALTGGDASRAPDLFRRHGCAGCHSIPGIAGADGKVGAPLTGLRERIYIAGVVNNTSENLIGWIVSPQRFSPNSAMPATGISETEARDLAAYLYAH
jgi:cytochrome c2